VAAVLWERWRGDEEGDAAAVEVGPAAAARHDATHLLPGPLTPIDLAGVLRGVRDLLAPLCAQHAAAIRLAPADRLPPALGERVALRQALLALLAPLIVASAGRTLTIEAAGEEHQVLTMVRGDGEPSEPAIRQGLSECRPFVEALRGGVRYAPPAEPGGGWTIRLALPASDRPTLLVVDNNADFVRLVGRYLTGHGWEVVGAADVEQAQAETRRRTPRAILLDVVLPDRDGWELLLALKRRPATRDVPVIVCSVLNEPAVALSLGAAAYLHKPITQRQLLGALAGRR
jgi:CheY-like chemotaxis protein